MKAGSGQLLTQSAAGAFRAAADSTPPPAQKMEMAGQPMDGLAHDLNNLLHGIIVALNLIQRGNTAGRHEEVGKYADAALASAHRAVSMTSRLPAFGRRQSMDIKPVDVAAVTSSLEFLLTRSIGESIRLTMKLDPAVAMTDANKLEGAILALAANACDAMPDGGELTIETSEDGDEFVSLIVRDTGHGMTSDVLGKVFEPFFTTKPNGRDAGLGLSMVHSFVNQSGGSIGITSAPGEGAEVTILLPLADRRPPRTEHAKTEHGARHVARGAGETVLVVDDNAQVRMLVLEVLSQLGYEILEASDAPGALEQLEGQRVDLLISDVGLPGLSGPQLAEMARSRSPGLRVLFMTGCTENAKLCSTFPDASMGLVTKPFEIDAFAAKIRSMMTP